jgi:hypothetical protein
MGAAPDPFTVAMQRMLVLHFRADTTVYRHTSVCRNEMNKLPETEEQKP